MASTYEELIQAGYSRKEALRTIAKESEIESRVSDLETVIDGNDL